MAECIRQVFRGAVEHKIDPKGRVAVPAEWRAGGSLDLLLRQVTRQGFEVLRFYTEARIEEMVTILRSSENLTVADKEAVVASLHESCINVTMNNQGKVQIPKRLIEKLKLPNDVLVVGRGEEFEIHDPVTYEKIKELERPSLEKLNVDFGFL